MNYSILLLFCLFCINNLLHQISEKVIIVIFLMILFILVQVVSNLINSAFKQRIDLILSDINMYMNSLLNFLYLNKVIYVTLKKVVFSYKYLFKLLRNRTSNIFLFSTLGSKFFI
jgi:hypothetical protein